MITKAELIAEIKKILSEGERAIDLSPGPGFVADMFSLGSPSGLIRFKKDKIRLYSVKGTITFDLDESEFEELKSLYYNGK